MRDRLHLSRSAFPVLVVCSLVLLLAGTAPSVVGRLQAAPTIWLNPTSGPPGATVTVMGSGWSYAQGEIRWDSSAAQPALGTFQPNPNGAFSVNITIPSGASAGAHTVWACQYCGAVTRPQISASAPFTVTGVIQRPTEVIVMPTPRPLPTACDPSGAVGEVVVDFEDWSLGTRLDGVTTDSGISFLGEDALVVFRPVVATRSPTRALMNDFGGREFGSINIPIRIGLEQVADFVGVFVGLNEQIWADEPFTATLTAFGLDSGGHRTVVGTDSETLGPAATPIRTCLSVEAAGRIIEVTIDYSGTGGVAEPEVIDDLIVRFPEEPVPVPEDDLPPVVEILEPADGILLTEPYFFLQGTVAEDRELERVEVWLNDSLYQEIGFTPAGYTEIGDRNYLFGLGGFPVSSLLPCVINRIEVRAFDAAGNPGEDLTTIRSLVGDLEIASAEAVQAVYGAPLVQGKATAFRVRVDSTFACPVNTSFRLVLPEAEWHTLPPATGLWVPAVHEGMAFPDVWGPVTIPGNATEFAVMLPYLAPGAEGTAWDESASPAGMLEGREAGGVYGPDVRVVPRPVGTVASFTVEIDPDGSIVETDEANNQSVSPPQAVYDTHGIRLYFVPWLFNLTPNPGETESDYEYYLRESGYTDVATRLQDVIDAESRGAVPISVAFSADDIERLHREATRYVEYLLGSFPLADSEVSFVFSDTMYFEDEYLEARALNTCHYWSFHGGVNDTIYATHPDVDVVIMFRAMGCCGQSPGVYVDAGLELLDSPAPNWHHLMTNDDLSPGDEGYTCWDWTFPLEGAAEYVIGHELSHNLLGMGGECYDCNHSDVACGDCDIDAEGFWVNRWIPIPQGTDYMMESICDGCLAWNRLEPSHRLSGGLNPDGYRHAIEAFAPGTDPRVLLLRGDMARDGQIQLQPFLTLQDGVTDLREGQSGDYSIVLLGSQDEVLSTWGFNVSFTVFGPPPSTPTDVDVVHLSHRVVWQEGTRRIEIRDGQGNVLASREVSAAAPEIEILEPNGDEVWSTGRTYAIRWRATDADGDSLSFSLALSPNNGQTWVPLDIDVTEQEFDLRTNGLGDGGEYLIRVQASDGVNTSSDVSDAPFHIEVREGLEMPQLVLLVGLLVLAVAGIGMIAAAFLLQWRQARR